MKIRLLKKARKNLRIYYSKHSKKYYLISKVICKDDIITESPHLHMTLSMQHAIMRDSLPKKLVQISPKKEKI